MPANKIRLEKTPSPPSKALAFQSAMSYLDAPVLPEAIEAIDADGFTQRTFTSSNAQKIPDKVLIDLASETVSVPRAPEASPGEDSIFHPNVKTHYFFSFF